MSQRFCKVSRVFPCHVVTAIAFRFLHAAFPSTIFNSTDCAHLFWSNGITAIQILIRRFSLFYSDGSRTDFGRSVANSTRWAYLDTKSTTTFLDLNHRVSNDWKFRIAYSHNDGDYLMKHLYRGGYPDHTTGLGMNSIAANYDGKRVYDSPKMLMARTAPCLSP